MKPKVTVGILTYNHEKYIEKCLRSVLSLDYENLEIIISDDFSTDKTFEIVKSIVDSESIIHSVILNRNCMNLGVAGNFNRTFGEIATGEFLITLGGDDIIKRNYLEQALPYFVKDPLLMMLDFNADIIDGKGKTIKPARDLGFELKLSNLGNYFALDPISSFAPGRIIRRNLIDDFEPISLMCPTEDSVLVFRALLLGKHGRLNKDVILYRIHSANISGAGNILQISNSRIIAQYLKDIVFLYNKNIIKERNIVKLMDRVNFELHVRNVLFNTNKTVYDRLKFRLRRFLYYKS